MDGATIRINKYLPIAIIYFFFNSFLLPQGLLYTTLLTPLLLLWLYRFPSFNYIWIFFFISAPFVLVHLWNGVDIKQYLFSYLSLFTTYVFGICFYQFLKECTSLSQLFRSIILINFAFVLVAFIFYFIPGLKDAFWLQTNVTSGFERTYRLKLLTYEASYYSFLLAPIALYYYLRIILQKYPDKWLTFLLITLPLVFSLSFGVIAGLILTIFFIFCSDIRLFSLSAKLPGYIIAAVAVLIIFFLFLWKLFPDNILFVRIANVFQGQDTSFRGRTFDSLYLGWKLAAQKSILFGIGPGQIKVIGLDTFTKFYKWDGFTTSTIAIPNSIGDILAVFGVLGVLLKLSLEIYFFFKTQVYSNYYRLALFLFIFIYQFTGSFISNIAEYVIWLMAFYPNLFPEFDKKKIFQGNPALNF